LTETVDYNTLDDKLSRAQKIMNIGAGQAVTGGFSYNEAVRDAVKMLVREGITGFIDIGGHEWSPEAYVFMDIRTTIHNTAIKAQQTRAQEYGVSTFQISSKAEARPLCAPYQGVICSWNRGDRGQVTDLDGNVHDYVSIYDTSYGAAAGIFGINCGHFPETFVSGLSVPRYEKLSQAELEKNGEAYEKSQVQRKLERDVRDAKTYAKALEAAGDKVGYSVQLKKVQEKRAAYAAYCLENGLDERTDKLVVHGFKRGNNG
jgi:hypothetical protein